MTLTRTRMRRRVTPQTAASRRTYTVACTVVERRSGGLCEICGGHGPAQHHHRKARQAGGSSRNAEIHSPANLLHVCQHCHQMAEEHPDRWTFGWKVHRQADPAATAVLLVLDGWESEPSWHLLDDEGGRTPAPEGSAA